MTDIADTLAPWAEIVPDTGPMTTEDLLALPDDGWQYELVGGRLVRMPPSGLDASMLALRLGGALIAYVEAHNLGRATGADGGYEIARTGGKATTLAPDAAFIGAERLPRTSPSTPAQPSPSPPTWPPRSPRPINTAVRWARKHGAT
jgi:Uma2 family endonuclease